VAVRKRPSGARYEYVRQFVLSRDGHVCQISAEGCRGIADTVDHIIPISRGGHDGVDNLRAACTHCNSSRGGPRTSRAWRPGARP